MQTIKRSFPTSLLLVLITALALSGCEQKVSAPGAQPSPSPSTSPGASPADAASPQVGAAGQGSMTGGASSTSPPTSSQAAPGSAPSASSATGPPPPAPQSAAPAPPPPPPPTPRTFTLAAGRPISIYTATSLSTKTSKNGDVFVASLANAIVDGEWVVARRGAQVEGVVTDSDPGGKVKGVASLAVRLRSLQLADGRTIAISTGSYVREAKSTKKKDAAKIGIAAGVGAAIGAIAGGGKGAAIGAGVGGGGGTAVVMATRGDPAVIPGESQISLRLTAPVTVTKR